MQASAGQSPHESLSSETPDRDTPYLSVAVTGRNGLLQAFIDRWIEQAKRHDLRSELLLVEWSPALRWPDDAGLCDLRIVEVPAGFDDRHARNVAIRRARGEFILVTEAGVLFSGEVMRFLASRRLEKGRLYRIDRHDVTDIPVDGTLDEQLSWCRNHVTRVFAREGTFPVTADGSRSNGPDDITRDESGIYFGSGWFPVERDQEGKPFRWMENDAEVFLRMPRGGRVITLEVEPGPGIGHVPATLQVLDGAGATVAEWKLDKRISVELAVPPARTGEVQSFRLRVPEGGLAVPDDPRILNLRVFRCDWVDRESQDGPPSSSLSVIRENRPILARLLGALRAQHGLLSLPRLGPGVFRSAVRVLESRGKDIFEAGGEFRFGQGWYELEESGGERFRWASQDAELLLRITREHYRLVLLVEPGPGAGSQPCILIVRDRAGNVISRAPLNGLTSVRVPLPLACGMTTTLFFTVEGGGLATAGDSRIMDFRVFACGGESGSAVPTASSDIHDCWSTLTVATQPVEIDWRARLEKSREHIAEMGKPPFLHVNGCGSFLLMAREHWLDVRGYAELDPSLTDVESLLCYTAHYAGAREEVLPEPMRVYQVEGDCGRVGIDQELARLITEMRTLHVPFIFNPGGWGMAAPKRRQVEAPYISVVIVARNDNHGGNMLGRMQAFFNAWLGQSERYGLASEIIVVEWNPPANCPKLIDSLQWPSGTSSCQVRFIDVPAEIHRRYPNPDTMPLHQMIAKNAGIRRARGEFVLATNLDIVFSAELMQFLALRRLEPRRMYRMDRYDVSSAIPAQAGVNELLAFCQSHTLRIFTGEGGFEFGPCGLRELESDDIVAPDAGIRFGPGWYGVEAYEAERFRWIAEEAEILFQKPAAGARLSVDVETGPSAGGAGVGVEIVNSEGAILKSGTVKGRCHLLVDVSDPLAAGFRLRVLGGGVPLTNDLRMLNLRVFGLQWDGGELGSILEVSPTGPTVDWNSFDQAASPDALRMRNPRYLHTNASGDFTLLSRDDWFALRGYPEFPIWPMHIDSLLCYAAHHAGIRETVLGEPMRMFHIEHMSGAGWTPEGEAERRARIQAKGVSSFAYRDVEKWVDCMRRFNAPMIFPRRDWGLAGENLRETMR